MDSCFNYDDFDDEQNRDNQNNQDNELNRDFQNNSENNKEENKNKQNNPDEDVNNNLNQNFNNNLPEVNRMRMSAENYFEQISAIPRLKYDRIIAFLKDWADSNGFTYGTNSFKYKPKKGSEDIEEGQNIWIDIPASEGYENYPNVILQGHLDMICKKNEGSNHNFETDPIKIIKTDNFITADSTTLGADNGIGIAIMMAIATGNSKHGSIRLLMTGNEEKGCEGAASLDPTVLNADYLINLDYEDISQICYSSAGNSNITMTRNYIPKFLEYSDNVYRSSITDLTGGHSGLEINKGRLPANVIFTVFFNELLKRGIHPKLLTIDTNSESNAISNEATLVFTIPDDGIEIAEIIFNNLNSKFHAEYEDEKFEWSLKPEHSFKNKFLSEEDSTSLIKFLSELPQGIIDVLNDDGSLREASPEEKRKKDVPVGTSSNTGSITLNEGQFIAGICSRSCNDNVLLKLKNDISNLGIKYGFHVESNFAPAWYEDPNTPLVRLVRDAYNDSTAVDAKLIAVHAGLECSIFAEQKSNIQLVSMGPTIDGAHTTEETLYTDTIEPCINVINYCLEHINEINND